MSLRVKLTPKQSEFYKLYKTCKRPGFVAGLGAGKSNTLFICALSDTLTYAGATIAIYLPSYDLLNLNCVPRISAILEESNIDYDLNRQKFMFRLQNDSTIIMRSMSNPERIVSYEAFTSHCDELDTLKRDDASFVYRKIVERTRQKVWAPSTPKAQRTPANAIMNKVAVYTTPDGGLTGFTASMYNEPPSEDFRMVQAGTLSNIFLPSDYVENLKITYADDPDLIACYLEGRFINREGKGVYRSYKKLEHGQSTENLVKGEIIYVGLDFNIGKMNGVIAVNRHDGLHVIDEFATLFDTEAVIDHLHTNYVDLGHRVVIAPDASSQSRKTASKFTDEELLRRAGFDVRTDKSNPLIRDRVMCVNNAFTQGRLSVKSSVCKSLDKSLREQAYDASNLPSKSGGLDHIVDSLGYLAWQLIGLRSGGQGYRTVGT